MKYPYYIVLALVLATFISCSDDLGRDSSSPSGSPGLSEDSSGGSVFDSSGGGSSGSDPSGNNGTDPGTSGLITAGEWNDLDNWPFWNDVLGDSVFLEAIDMWGFSTHARVAVEVLSGAQSLIDAPVELYRGAELIWSARTDNYGKAELWVDLYDLSPVLGLQELTISVLGQRQPDGLTLYDQGGVNKYNISINSFINDNIELSFIVDATGSMSDELEFLKDDLESVINAVENSNSSFKVSTSAVFYRDEGDEYVVRSTDFSEGINNTLSFINEQSAGGGGDFPEAVHSAMSRAIMDLSWSDNARTRIAFLLLDAPPHNDPQVIDEIQKVTKVAAEKGIKIIPITASGINKQTELLMRYMAAVTNGTYVFITNDSGIGNDHLTATVGDYDVEFLNDLMVRLINKYSL